MSGRRSRISSRGVTLASIAALSGLTLCVGSVAAATGSTPDRIRACAARSDGALRVVRSNEHCGRKEDALHWNVVGPRGERGPRGARGPQGPSGVVNVTTLNTTGGDAVSGDIPGFIGDTATIDVTNRRTTAVVTGSLDVGTIDGEQVQLRLGVCVQRPGHDARMTSYVVPNITMPVDDYVAQSISGAIGDLPDGSYTVGLCTSNESDNVIHGFGYAVVTVMQSATRTDPVEPGDSGGSPFVVTQR